MARLNYGRQEALEIQRVQYAKKQITDLGYTIIFENSTQLNFEFNGSVIQFFPYSGWHTGKTIKDGRGLNKLLSQINN